MSGAREIDTTQQSGEDTAKWLRRIERERRARSRAEAVLEQKSLELYGLNQSLESARSELERRVDQRTDALQSAVEELRREAQQRHRVEEELRRARDAAIEVSSLKTQFLARMSHEIRTPLNAVIGLTGLLLESELDAEQRKHMDTVRTSGQMLLHIINDILDMSKIDAGKLELEFAPTDIGRVIKQSLSLVLHEAKRKGIDLLTQTPAIMPQTLVLDGGRLQQILVNLLSNAVKYSERGTVTVAVRLSAYPRDFQPDLSGAGRLAGGRNWQELEIAVTDEGHGIAEADVLKLFQPFTQLQSQAGYATGSSGLGLAICDRLCTLMGGSIDVVSAPGTGSTFSFRLPCLLDLQSPAPQGTGGTATEETNISAVNQSEAQLMAGADDTAALESRLDMARRFPLSVLLADDHEVNRMVLRAQLESLGYRSDAVANGEEVIRALNERSYDVVLMDIRMPVMDGIEATRHIRSMTLETQPFIAAITASALPGDRETYLAAGMDAYISKPVDVLALADTLERAHGNTAADRQAGGTDVGQQVGAVHLALDQLYRELGPHADMLLRRVIPVYIRELPGRVETLRKTHEAGDVGGFGQVCHGLKGTSRSVGALELADACERFELEAYEGRLPESSELEVLVELAFATSSTLESKLADLSDEL